MLTIKTSNGTLLTLKEGEKVRLNKSIGSLGELNTRSGDFSFSFKVMRTEEMNKLFGYGYDFRSVDYKKKYSASAFSNNLEIAVGFLTIEKITKQYYECRFFSGNSNVFDSISGLTLKELDYNGLEVYWLMSEISQSQSNVSSNGYWWLWANYGQMNGRYNFNSLTLLDFMPCLFYDFLIKKIFSQIGYNVSGDLLDDANFKKCGIVFSDEIKPLNVPQFEESGNRSISDPIISYAYEDFAFPSDAFEIVTNTIPLTTYDSNFTDIRFIPPFTATYTVKLTLNCLYRNGNFQDAESPNIRVRFGNDNGFYGLSEFVQTTVEDGGVVTSTIEFEQDIILKQDESYYFYIDYIYYGADFFVPGEFEPNSAITIYAFDVNVKTNIALPFGGCQVDLNACAPELSVSDFLKVVLNQFAAFAYFYTQTNTVFLNKYENIPSKQRYDWTEKVNTLEALDVVYDTVQNAYAQNNLLKYSEDSNDTSLDAYFQKYGKSFGDGSFEISEDTIELQKTIVELQVAPTINERMNLNLGSYPNPNNFDYLNQVPFIPIWNKIDENDTNVYYINDNQFTLEVNYSQAGRDGQDLATYKDASFQTENLIGTVTSRIYLERNDIVPRCIVKADVVSSGSEVALNAIDETLYNKTFFYIELDETFENTFINSDVSYSFFAKSPAGGANDSVIEKFSLAFDKPLNGSDFANDYQILTCKASYWNNLVNTLQDARTFECSVRLKDYEFASLDLTRPVYIEQTGSIFYINEIDGYNPDDTYTSVVLVKI